MLSAVPRSCGPCWLQPAIRRSRIPRVGLRSPSSPRRLSRHAHPVWCRACSAQVRAGSLPFLVWGSGLDPLEGMARLGLSPATPQGGVCWCIARLCPHWPPRWGGQLGAPSAMALDLGCSLILWSLLALAGYSQIAHPAGGIAQPLQSTALKASARAPFGAARACRKSGLAERRFDVRLRPGSAGGYGAPRALACIAPGGLLFAVCPLCSL